MREQGRDHALVVVAEGVKTPDGQNISVAQVDGVRYGGIGQYLSARLNEIDPRFSTRVTVLGHVQRGGVPAAHDRLAASCFGVHAVDVLAQGKTDRMVVWKSGTITDVGLDEVAAIGTAKVDPNGMVVKTARGLGMYIGE